MARKHIFEILENKWNIIDEIKRIYKLLNTPCINESQFIDKSVFDFVDENCFLYWKNRHSYLNIRDMAITLGIELNKKNIPNTLKIDGILTYLEFASNIIMLCDKEVKVILFEKNPSAIAVAEVVDEDTACKVIEYNHYLLKGDIDKKKKFCYN